MLRSDAYQLSINDDSCDVISHRKTPQEKKISCYVSVELALTKCSDFPDVSVPTHEEKGREGQREGGGGQCERERQHRERGVNHTSRTKPEYFEGEAVLN